MLSRVADNLYWLGRYLQRAENTARLINVNTLLLLDLPRRVTLGWEPLIEIVGAGEVFREHYKEPDEAKVARFLIVDERNPGSILSSLRHAREALRTTRDCMPGEVWEKLNDLYLFAQDKGERSLARARRHDFLDEIIDSTLQMYGLMVSNMSYDVGFQFLRIGTNLEQADMTTRILDARSAAPRLAGSAEDLAPFNNALWMSVLRSLTAYQMYRRHVRSRVSGLPVLRFLLQNREFPRSVMFCLFRIGSTLPRLPPSRKVERTLERIRALVKDADFERLLESGLHELLDEIQKGLGQLHEAISDAYFRV